MKKIVILLFAVLAQAVYVFGEELAREFARECGSGGLRILSEASHARIKAAFGNTRDGKHVRARRRGMPLSFREG